MGTLGGYANAGLFLRGGEMGMWKALGDGGVEGFGGRTAKQGSPSPMLEV